MSDQARKGELAVSTGRPPRASMIRPIRGDTTPPASKPTDNPATITDNGHPVSASIGFASTARR